MNPQRRSWTQVGRNLCATGRQMLALFGLTALLGVGAAVAVASRDDARLEVQRVALAWLQADAKAPGAGAAEAPADASPVGDGSGAPTALPSQQAAVSLWLSRRYRVAPDAVAPLVRQAWESGHRVGVDPTLILAVIAVESSFNPFAQSAVGAQGLMQVMTRVHDDKFQPFGGVQAALDPLANIQVGVQVLRECITRAGGSLEAGLRYYVGASGPGEDAGYADKVLAEQGQIRRVAQAARPGVQRLASL